MSTQDKLREAFEAYFAKSRKSRGAGRCVDFSLRDDGTYADDHTQRHWWTWQCALAAQEAEPVAWQWRRKGEGWSREQTGPVAGAPTRSSARLTEDQRLAIIKRLSAYYHGQGIGVDQWRAAIEETEREIKAGEARP